MAVVGTAYVHIKALANGMAKDIERSLQPLAKDLGKAGNEAGKEFSDGFNKSLSEGEDGRGKINPADGLAERAKPDIEKYKEEFDRAEKEIVRNNQSNLDRLAANFRNTGKRASNGFVANFGTGGWFRLIHTMYDAFLFLTPAIGMAGGALTQIVSGLYSMISAMGPAVNLLGVMPGLLYGLVGSYAALRIGLGDSVKSISLGFKAMKAMASGSKDASKAMQKYLESLEGLGPEARAFAESIVGLSGKFSDIASNIQTALLPGLTAAVGILSQNGTIDAFGRSFEGIAGQIGKTALSIAQLTNQPFFRGSLATVFDSTTTVVGLFGGSLRNVIEALVNLAAAASPVTEQFANWINVVTGNWAAKSQSNFDGIRRSMLEGASAIKLLMSVVGNLWGTLTNLGRAGKDAGRGLWESFDSVTQKWKEFTGSVQGQKSLKEFFDKSAEGTRALGEGFASIGRTLAKLATHESTIEMMKKIGPVAEQIGDMILRMTDEAGPALQKMGGALLDLLDVLTEGQGVSAFADTITFFAKALSGLLNMPGGHQFLVFMATFIGIWKASSIIAQVTGFRNAVSGVLKTVSNVNKAGSLSNWVRGIDISTKEAGKSVSKFNTGFFGGMARMRDAAGIAVRGVGKRFSSLGQSIGNAFKGSNSAVKAGMDGSAKAVAASSATMAASGKAAGAAASGGVVAGLRSRAGQMKTAAGTAASGVGKAFTKAGAGIKSGFGKTMGFIARMNPFGMIINAILTLLPIFIMLYQSSDKFRNAVDGAFKAIMGAIEPLMPVLQSLMETLSGVFKTILEKVGPPVMEAFSQIATAIGQAMEQIAPVLDGLMASIGPLIDSIASAIGPVIGTLATTLGSVFSQLAPVIGQVAAQLGPVLQQLGPVLGQAFSQLGAAVQQLLPVLGTLVTSVFSALGPVIAALLPVIGQLVSVVVQLVSQAFAMLMPVVMQIVSSVLPLLITAFNAIIPVILKIATSVLPLLINLLAFVLPIVLKSVVPIIVAVIQAVVPIITSIIQILTGVITFLTGVFSGNWSMIWDGIKQIFSGVWNAIIGIITGVWGIIKAIFLNQLNFIMAIVQNIMPGITNFIRDGWNAMIGFFSGILSTIVSFFVNGWNSLRDKTIAAFVAIRTGITNAFNAVKTFVLGIVANVVNGVMNTWNRMRSNTLAVYAGIRTGIANAVNAVRTVVSNVFNSIRNTVSNVGNAVRNSTSNAWNAFKNIIQNAINNAMGFVRSVPGRIRQAFGNAGSMLRSVGSQIVQGLVNGLKGGMSWVTNAAKNLAKNAINAAKSVLGIKSPSRVFRDLGKFTGQGYVKGLQGTASSVKGASEELAKKVTSAFKSKVISKKTFDRTMAVIKSGNTRMQQLANQRASVAAQYKAAQEKLTEAINKRNEYAKSTTESMMGVLDLGKVTKNMSFDKVLGIFEASTKKVKQFQADLTKLKKLGLSDDLYQQIVAAGAERGSELATALSSKGQAGISQINQEYRNLMSASTSVGNQASNVLYGAGVSVAQGMIKGLQSQEKKLAAQAAKMAKSVSAAVKKALKIKSPSRVLAELGKMTAQGLIEGMDAMGGAIASAATQMGKTTIAGAQNSLSAGIAPTLNPLTGPVANPTLDANGIGLSATINDSSSWDDKPILSPQNQAIVNALARFLGTTNYNTFNVQKDKPIQQLAQEISRELERLR